MHFPLPIPSSSPSGKPSAPRRCRYTNDGGSVQVVRLTRYGSLESERVLFPGQSMTFMARPDTLLELYESALTANVRADSIPCACLQIAG